MTRCTPAQFQQHLKSIESWGLRPCSLEDYSIDGEEKGLVALTFDDGYESLFFNVYPALNSAGFTFTVFMIAGFIGKSNGWEVRIGGRKFRHLSWQQLQSMENFEIGSHSLNHLDLTGLDEKALCREVGDSKKILEDGIGKPVTRLSLPFGRWNRRVLDCCREAGYKNVYSLNPNYISEDGFLEGRYGVYLFDGKASLKAKLNPGFANHLEKFRLKFFNRLSGGTVLVKKWRGER